MQKPFSLFVGLRYSLARKNNLLLSFVSLISMLGISLGVLILIVALAVINGSIATLRGEALKSVPHVTVSGPAIVQDWQAAAERAQGTPGVLAAAPFLEGEALLRYQGQDQFIQLRGVDAVREAAVVENPGIRYSELLTALGQVDNGLVLGTRLAARLGIFGADEVSIVPLDSLLARDLDAAQGFQVVGFADFGVYGDDNMALIKLDSARALFPAAGNNLQLRLKVDDVYAAGRIADSAFGGDPEVAILPWNEAQASLFNALNMEKILTGFMLLMIVVIGAVNIVSTLVMVVADKSADIAILRTMGASRGRIMAVFMIQGMVAGVFGTLVGAVLGVLLAGNITTLSLWLEQLINSLVSGANVYLLSHLQTRVDWSEVALVCVAALGVSFLATLYPAYRASRVQPAEVLRYE
ncbi:MAG: FtsX-like permease family protein [Pseudohongiellaceae bacterium]